MMSSIQTSPKVFDKSIFLDLIKQADSNHDGSTTKAEWDYYQQHSSISDNNSQDSNDVMKIITNNFASIANNAKKAGENLPVHVIHPDSIEASDINRLATFDGYNNDISITDVSKLQNSNTTAWPTDSTTGSSYNKIDFSQLLKILLIFLLFRGGGGLLGNSGSNQLTGLFGQLFSGS